MDFSRHSKIRVLLLDDHALFLAGAGRFFSAQPDFAVEGQTRSVEQALEVLRARPVDIVLLDVDLGKQRGSEFLVRAREARFSGPVLVLTGGISDRERKVLLAHGAAGVVLKSIPLELLVDTIRGLVAAAHVPASPEAPANPGHERRPLTQRERDVLRAVFEGFSNKEIAARLGISEASVKAALQQLFVKTGVRSRGQLVRAALERYSDQL